MVYTKESDFEEDLIKVLSTKGWEKDVIKYPTEQRSANGRRDASDFRPNLGGKNSHALK